MSTVTLEIDGPHNEAIYFRPLSRRVRGRWDYMRMGEPNSKIAAASEPNPIPSQRIGYDLDKQVGFIDEPLHASEHKAIRERIEARGQRLPAEREEFTDADAATWLFWLKSAVEAGIARVVEGKLPDKLPGKPRVNFITTDQPTATDKLTVAIDKQTAVLEKQAELFAALLKKLG